MSEQEPLTEIEEIEQPLEDGVDDQIVDDSSTDTIIFKRAHLYTVLLPLAFVAGLLVGFIFWGRELPANGAGVAAPPQQNQPAQQPAAADQGAEPTPEFRRYDIPEDDNPVWGPSNAPITIIEFSDYECPYCRKWHLEVWPQLQAEYNDQIRLVYRDFPLTSIHGNASPAAVAANCALEQDMYWEFNEKLFSMELDLSETAYFAYAEQLGLNMDTFTECLDSGRQEAEVTADYEYAANLGVRSTPTFFVNGIPVVGAQPFEVFQNVIDQELAGELPQ